MNCKNCNKELPERGLSKFCSAACVIEYEEGKKQQKNPVSFPFLIPLKRNGYFFIHNKTLSGYVNMKSFEDFLIQNKLMIVRLDDKEFDLSVIKPSIL